MSFHKSPRFAIRLACVLLSLSCLKDVLGDDLQVLSVAPTNGFIATGPVAGPFTPNSITFTLTNSGTGTDPLTWTALKIASWLEFSPSGGTLVPGGPSVQVTAQLSSDATNQPIGRYAAQIVFRNLNNSASDSRIFVLRVAQPSDWFTQDFDTGGTNLSFHTFTFTPDGGPNFYSACTDSAVGFPTDPAGGTNANIYESSSRQVVLTGTNTVQLYGLRTNVFYIGGNGTLMFDSGAVDGYSLATHFSRPRISGLFNRILPQGGGLISWKQLIDRVAVTCQNVPDSVTLEPNSFQIEMFYDGRIRLTYLEVNCPDPLIGLSAGTNVPADFQQSDFSAYPACARSAPAIVLGPSDHFFKPGDNAVLQVAATGSLPLSFQWRKNGTDVVNDNRISGANTASLGISNLSDSDSAQYSVVVTNDSGFAVSSNATLLVSALDHFHWSHIPSPQSANIPFNVTIEARDSTDGLVTNFPSHVAFTALEWLVLRTNTILAANPYSDSSSGNFTVGYSFTPNTDLMVTAVRHYFGTKVSIWTDSGILVASQDVVSTPGAWVETPLSAPIHLNVGTTYRVGCFSGPGDYYYREDMGENFPDGIIDQSYVIVGDAFPTNVNSSRWFLVDLRYRVGPSASVPMLPSASSDFLSGIWTGSVVVARPVTNLTIQTHEVFGHWGESELIQIADGPTLGLQLSDGSLSLSWPSGAPGLVLEASTNLVQSVWTPVQSPILPTGDLYQVSVPLTEPQKFYRLRYSSP